MTLTGLLYGVEFSEQGFEEDEVRALLYAMVHTIAYAEQLRTNKTQTRSYRLAYKGFDCVVNIAADPKDDGNAYVVTAYDLEKNYGETGGDKKTSSSSGDPNALVYSAKSPGWLPEPEGATHEASSTPSAVVGALMKDRVSILNLIFLSSQELHDQAAKRPESKNGVPD